MTGDNQVTKYNCDKQFKGKVLFVGHSYYHAWYLSRELRKLGWKADVLNWDINEKNQIYYHGEDFKFYYRGIIDLFRQIKFYIKSLFEYDIFHFSNAFCMRFGFYIHHILKVVFLEYAEIRLLKWIGKKIVYSNNGCHDGVSKTSFSKWGKESVCDICRWRNVAAVCNDKKSLKWGKIRNIMADYQITIGGNRVDYNNDFRVNEVPEFYCLDPDFWNSDLVVPEKYRLNLPVDTIKIYHTVGNFNLRTDLVSQKNIKCSHIYFPLVERLKSEGYKVELIFFHGVPNKELRYYQVQADIVVDMLTYGWFGANVREALMLGKPAVCYIRPEWLESVRREIPEYAEALPVISATPQTIYAVLKDLLEHPEKRRQIGKRSREFALKWHSAQAGARRLNQIYSSLLSGKMEPHGLNSVAAK